MPVKLSVQQFQMENPIRISLAEASSSPESNAWAEQGELQKRNDPVPLLYLGLLLFGILVFGVMRYYKHAQKPRQISKEALMHWQRERQQLLQNIANLDDQYAQGMIKKQVYFSERKRIKQRLVELTIQCKTLS